MKEIIANLPQRTEKPWGYELLIAHCPEYAGKVIFVNKGYRLSLQYHRKKDESTYIFQGKVELELEQADGKLKMFVFKTGDTFRISPETRHRLKALEDCTLFEVSTPQLEDVVRLHDDYGRKIDTP